MTKKSLQSLRDLGRSHDQGYISERGGLIYYILRHSASEKSWSIVRRNDKLFNLPNKNNVPSHGSAHLCKIAPALLPRIRRPTGCCYKNNNSETSGSPVVALSNIPLFRDQTFIVTFFVKGFKKPFTKSDADKMPTGKIFFFSNFITRRQSVLKELRMQLFFIEILYYIPTDKFLFF